MNIPHPDPQQKPVSDILWYSLRSPANPGGSIRIKSHGMSSTTGAVDSSDVVDNISIPIAAISATDEDGNPLLPKAAAAYAALLEELPAITAEWSEKQEAVREALNPTEEAA